MFVSCGQRPGEKEVAGKIGTLLEKRGFDVYVAIDAQTILDINGGIIRELKSSDCYLFVNFCREKVDGGYRGSLFSNQELAIAYALDFDRILVVNQQGILPEGMLRYIGVNTETFVDFGDCCAVVERALSRSKWTTDYSRRLKAEHLRFSDGLIKYGNLVGLFLYVDIQNHRPDIAALDATARLSEFGHVGDPLQPCHIRAPLKATGRTGHSHTIFPKSHEAFDLLCVGTSLEPHLLNHLAPPLSGALVGIAPTLEPSNVFLNTALDVAGAHPLPITLGVWLLRYEFFAIGFPVLSVTVELTLESWNSPTARVITQDEI